MRVALKTLRQESGSLACLACGKCSTLCPLSDFGGYPASRLAAIHDPVDELSRAADSIQRCLTCGSCQIRCPQGVRFPELVRGLRALLPIHHQAICPHGGLLQAAARASADGPVPQRDLSWVDEDLRIADEGEVGLFVGCLDVLDVLFQGDTQVPTMATAKAAVKILNHFGIEPVVLAEERCCGHDLLWGGEVETFEKLAVANAAAFRERGVRRIVTACAECARTWSQDLPEVVDDYRPEVQHVAEFLAERLLAEDLPPVPRSDVRVTYQDPCRLARHLGVVDAPRQALTALGTELREMEEHGEDAVCCGTSGFLHCDATSRRIQEKRWRHVEATGADRLLTACPKCFVHLACARGEDVRRGRPVPEIAIEDWTVYTARRLAAAEPATGVSR